jgi:hypothetical protein
MEISKKKGITTWPFILAGAIAGGFLGFSGLKSQPQTAAYDENLILFTILFAVVGMVAGFILAAVLNFLRFIVSK